MVEILGFNEDLGGPECAKFYWEDNAECNDAQGQHNAVHLSREISSDVHVCTSISAVGSSPASSCWLISGVQHVAKFKEHARNTVAVHMAIVRLPHVDTDLVIHYNQPLELSPSSSSAAVARPDVATEPDGALVRGAGSLEAMARSLRVHDWGLFSNADEEDDDEEEDGQAPR